MSDDRPSVYEENGKWIYRASSFGNCIKELVAIRCGIKPAPWPALFKQKFADGHRGEDTIISMMEARGFTVTRRQEEINWEILPGIVIRGHIDGVSQYLQENPRIFDAKTTSAQYGIAPGLQAKYDLQLSIYGHALGLDQAMLAVGTKERFTGDVMSTDTHNVDTLPWTVQAIKIRAARIEALAKMYEETGEFPECDVESRYPCGVHFLHDDAVALDPYGVPVQVKPVLEDDSLDRYLADYREAQQDEATAKDRKANARKMIVQHIGGEGENRTTEKFVLSWTGSGVSTVLDKARLEKYLRGLGPGAPKIDDFYGEKSKAKSIDVKEIA